MTGGRAPRHALQLHLSSPQHQQDHFCLSQAKHAACFRFLGAFLLPLSVIRCSFLLVGGCGWSNGSPGPGFDLRWASGLGSQRSRGPEPHRRPRSFLQFPGKSIKLDPDVDQHSRAWQLPAGGYAFPYENARNPVGGRGVEPTPIPTLLLRGSVPKEFFLARGGGTASGTCAVVGGQNEGGRQGGAGWVHCGLSPAGGCSTSRWPASWSSGGSLRQRRWTGPLGWTGTPSACRPALPAGIQLIWFCLLGV